MLVDIIATHPPEWMVVNWAGRQLNKSNGCEVAMEDYNWGQRTLHRNYQRSDLIFSRALETSTISKLKYLSRDFNKAPVDIANTDK